MFMILYCLFLSLSFADSQTSSDPMPPEVSLHRGMWVLQGWGLTNMATGIPMAITSKDPQVSAFFQMNAGWNVVNVGLASASLIRKKSVDTQKIKRVFFVNTGLDVGYVIAGILLSQKGNRNNDPQQLGFGNSIVLQGTFLFVFDAFMGWKMHKSEQ